ncbi:unnamed protein product [Sympodiomycopsis kandeliae]
MHGVKRQAAPSASQKAARKEKEAKKLEEYLRVESAFFDIKGKDQLDQEALDATTALLTLNPEFNTAWNYRRRVLSHLFQAPISSQADDEEAKPDVFASLRAEPQLDVSQPTSSSPSSNSAQSTIFQTRLIEDDLELTSHALRVHPKVYWIWNHRKWCLINLPEDKGESDERKRREAKWRMEMKLVDRMLELDPRNFHGWDYRRYLLSELALSSMPAEFDSASSQSQIPPFPYSLSYKPLPPSIKTHHLELANSELKYTLGKIESNFSNFSAWHWRSKLFPQIWKAENKSTEEIVSARDQELELLRQAMYTDPSDQSVWLYHAWLIDIDHSEDILTGEIESIEELLEVEPDSKWCIESLSRYKALLANESQSSNPAHARKLLQQSQDHLQTLQQVDPLRKNRYQDMLDRMSARAS